MAVVPAIQKNTKRSLYWSSFSLCLLNPRLLFNLFIVRRKCIRREKKLFFSKQFVIYARSVNDNCPDRLQLYPRLVHTLGKHSEKQPVALQGYHDVAEPVW